ncbi:MAG: nucleoside deaminase [Beijerinckiaceae bacterium]|nr:nucleoside deaminase [Beijerinckiaceae bacterium]MCI0736507.1 nucleoside deaminase [Beijerinckiaceae bacterium]
MKRDICRCGARHGAGLDRRRAFSSVLCAAGLAGLALSAPRPALAEAKPMAPLPQDEGFMRMALAEAVLGDFPFGAIIVRDGEVAAKGHNLSTASNDPTAHGEMVAIRSFVAQRPAAALQGTTLYTSGEPCPMCMSAIIWCGIGRVVFGASIEELAQRIGQIMLTSRKVANAAPFAAVAITGGVLSAEALALFRK